MNNKTIPCFLIAVASMWPAAIPLFGQQPRYIDPVIWDGSDLVYRVPGREPVVARENKTLKTTDKLMCPEGTIRADFFDEHYWAFSLIRDYSSHKPNFKYLLHKRALLGPWEKVAQLELEKLCLSALVPLQNDRFLAIFWRPMVKDDRGFVPFAIYKRSSKGELELATPMDAGFEKPLWDLNAGKSGDSYYSQLAGNMSGLNQVLRGDGWVAFAATRIGHIWVFSDVDGSMKQRIQLFSSSIKEEQYRGLKAFPPVILGIHPRQDGHILVSTRSEDAVERAEQAYPTGVYGPGSPLDAKKQEKIIRTIDEMESLQLKNFPFIAWYDLDPLKGTIQPETPPEGLPDRLFSREQLLNFNWRPQADGNLKLYAASAYTAHEESPKSKDSVKKIKRDERFKISH